VDDFVKEKIGSGFFSEVYKVSVTSKNEIIVTNCQVNESIRSINRDFSIDMFHPLKRGSVLLGGLKGRCQLAEINLKLAVA